MSQTLQYKQLVIIKKMHSVHRCDVNLKDVNELSCQLFQLTAPIKMTGPEQLAFDNNENRMQLDFETLTLVRI